MLEVIAERNDLNIKTGFTDFPLCCDSIFYIALVCARANNIFRLSFDVYIPVITRVAENVTLIRMYTMKVREAEYRSYRKFGNFLPETVDVIPLEFLIKDRRALVTATSIPRFAEHPLEWVGFPSTEKTRRRIFRIFVRRLFARVDGR